MKHLHTFLLSVAAIILSTTSNCQSQNNYILKSSTSTVKGTSSLHEWESEITGVDFKGTLITDANSVKEIKSGELKILVKGIKSTKGKIMDNKTYEAFDYEKNPYVTFKYISAKAGATGNWEINGTLSMAGNSRPLVLTATTKVLPNGEIRITASKKLKMTEFNMKPPTAVMGTIKVGDEVTLVFDITLVPSNNITNHNK